MSPPQTPNPSGFSHVPPNQGTAPAKRRGLPLPATLLILAIMAFFPYALYLNAGMLISGWQASGGNAGTAGEVTVVSEQTNSTRGGSTQCYGDFQGEDGKAESVAVELAGSCDEGDTVKVHLVEGYGHIGFSGYEEPRAWEEGATGWIAYLLLTLLFGVLSLITVLLYVMAPRAIKQALRKDAAPPVPPQYPTDRA